MEVVLDASVVTTALVEVTPEAGRLRRRLEEVVTHAPHLIDAEVGNSLRRNTAAGLIEPDVAVAGLRALGLLVAERYPHGPLSTAAWGLRYDLTYYDALYVALAARLARSPGLPCTVKLID